MTKRFSYINGTTLVLSLLAFSSAVSLAEWKQGTRFKVGSVNGKSCLVSPDGSPFKSVGMVWAYGPDRGPLSGNLTVQKMTNQLAIIQSMGFNTLNLYGDQFIPEMLAWCDRNEMAVYFRTSYYSLPDFPSDLRQYPDFMDPAFRRMAADYYKPFLKQIENHPSVLAVDMDHRWLFPLDWAGQRRIATPMLRPLAVAHFPKWLRNKYGSIAGVNSAWNTKYASFGEIIEDARFIKGGEVQDLANHPWRVDVTLYTLWTAADFLRELTSSMRTKVPGLLITPTTEHPECLPETNPSREFGIDFMSPVHYNAMEDFERDLPSLCKLIYETRWHYDMQGGPVVISETGWRTSPLEQDPPSDGYAFVKPSTGKTVARAYAEQSSLLNILPWIGGYAYFKLYDKWREGDFGYLHDDATKKPIALVGDAINRAFDTAALPDPEPMVWIYYPEYAQATHEPGFRQFKTWVLVWERPFFQAMKRRLDELWPALLAGDKKAGEALAFALASDFQALWRGFAFTKTLPDDDKPILLFSTVSELLSREDRAALLRRKTISFGAVGTRDTTMRKTVPWHLSALGFADAAETLTVLPLPHDTRKSPVSLPARKWDGSNRLGSLLTPMKSEPVECRGQPFSIPDGRFNRIEILAGAVGGSAAPSFCIEYGKGSLERIAMGPTVSDERFQPTMTEGWLHDGKYLSHIVIPLEPQRSLTSIRLPNAPWARIYLAALVSGESSNATVFLTDLQGNTVEGKASWCMRLNRAGLNDPDGLEVLQHFTNREPAVIAKGSHVAFLYDPFTWTGHKSDISLKISLHEQTVLRALEYVKGEPTP